MRSWAASGAAKKRPPVARATICSVSGLVGTRIAALSPPESGTVMTPFGVPTSTEYTGMCACRARNAAAAGDVRPVNCAPSEMTMIAAGGFVPSDARCRPAILVASATASPSEVPSAVCRFRSALTARSRSSVGGNATYARPAKPTIAKRYFDGSWSRNARASRRAASSRVGLTSSALIDSDVSMTRIAVASSRLTLIIACGRATPTTIAASAISRTASGRCRRQWGDASTMFGSRPGVVKRAA